MSGRRSRSVGCYRGGPCKTPSRTPIPLCRRDNASHGPEETVTEVRSRCYQPRREAMRRAFFLSALRACIASKAHRSCLGVRRRFAAISRCSSMERNVWCGCAFPWQFKQISKTSAGSSWPKRA